MNRLRKMLKAAADHICMTDRFLILFMIILFAYMIVYLFAGLGSPEDSNTINIIVRTSMASVFGYFISGNFTKEELSVLPEQTESSGINISSQNGEESSDHSLQNRIGFQTMASSTKQETGDISLLKPSSPSLSQRRNMQIVIVATIGLVSLVILLIAGRSQNVTPELTAMVSQLRDFVAASIGYLISCGKNTVR